MAKGVRARCAMAIQIMARTDIISGGWTKVTAVPPKNRLNVNHNQTHRMKSNKSIVITG